MAIYPNHNFAPLQPYFKYLKTVSILHKLMISRLCKTKGLMTILSKVGQVWKSKTQTPKGWTVHTAGCTIIPGRQNVCFVSYQGALLKQTSIK